MLSWHPRTASSVDSGARAGQRLVEQHALRDTGGDRRLRANASPPPTPLSGSRGELRIDVPQNVRAVKGCPPARCGLIIHELNCERHRERQGRVGQ